MSRHPTTKVARAQLAVQVVRARHAEDTQMLHQACRCWLELQALARRSRHVVEFEDQNALHKLLADAILAAPPNANDASDAAARGDSAAPASATSPGERTTRSWLRLWLPFAQRQWLAEVMPTPPADEQATPTPRHSDPRPWRALSLLTGSLSFNLTIATDDWDAPSPVYTSRGASRRSGHPQALPWWVAS